jgi:hypothetical protein
MVKFYTFLFYKLYRFSIAQKESVSLNFGFVCLATVFQELHLILLVFPYNYYQINFNLNVQLFSFLMLILGSVFNYFYFIRNKRIEKINVHFQNQKRIVWKENLLFFSYIIILFVIGYFQIFLLKRS